MNSDNISRNGRFGGGPVGSCSIPSGGVMANNTPERCRAVIASRFFTASKPKDKANRFASSCKETSSAILTYISRYIVEQIYISISTYSDCGEFFAIPVHFAFLSHYLVVQNVQTLLHR